MVLIALGANLSSRHGSPSETLKKAVLSLRDAGFIINAASRIWRSAPTPVSEQLDFFNAVIQVDTDLGPLELLRFLNGVEEKFGRIRSVRNEPRVLDLDIISYRGEIVDEDGLQIPHPRMCERAFVLMPLQEVVPDWIHPVSGQKIDMLIESLSEDQIIEATDERVA